MGVVGSQIYIPRVSAASRPKFSDFRRIARMIDLLYVIAYGSLTFGMPGVSDRPNVSFSFVAGILKFLVSACTECQDESKINHFLYNREISLSQQCFKRSHHSENILTLRPALSSMNRGEGLCPRMKRI